MSPEIFAAIIQGGALALLTFVLWRVDGTFQTLVKIQQERDLAMMKLLGECMKDRAALDEALAQPK